MRIKTESQPLKKKYLVTRFNCVPEEANAHGAHSKNSV
jgi:hypothetical protein